MRFDHLVVAVSDLGASLPWYAAVLEAIGFRKTREHVWVNEDGGAIELRQALRPDHLYLREGVGVNHVGFAAPSVAAIEAVGERLRAQGFDVPELQNFGDSRALFLKDRDGMRIEIGWEAG